MYQVIGEEYDKAWDVIAGDLVDQLWPETATWGLRYHEQKWQLPVREDLSYEQRRQFIYEKRDYYAPMTPYRMEKYLRDMTGMSVLVADIHDPGEFGFVAPHPNIFKVYFMGEGTFNSKQAHELINRIKQSHTVYTISQYIDFKADHTKLENIILRYMRMTIKCPFWGTRYFDGSEIMDGSHLMDAMPAYDLRPGILYGMGRTTAAEQFALAVISAYFAIPVKGNMYMGKQTVPIVIDLWRSLFLDRTAVKAMATCGAAAPVREEFGNATVRIQRHAAYFDGSLLMDGSHLMDSIDREETI